MVAKNIANTCSTNKTSWKLFLKNYTVICFCLYKLLISGEKMSSEFFKKSDDSRILIRILVGTFSGKYIRWLTNSSRISIRILVGNAVAAGCGIPMEFWLEFHLIPDSAKSADYLQFKSQLIFWILTIILIWNELIALSWFWFFVKILSQARKEGRKLDPLKCKRNLYIWKFSWLFIF